MKQIKKPSTPLPRPKPEMARKPAEAWLAENREALESLTAFVEAHGLPLASTTLAAIRDAKAGKTSRTTLASL